MRRCVLVSLAPPSLPPFLPRSLPPLPPSHIYPLTESHNSRGRCVRAVGEEREGCLGRVGWVMGFNFIQYDKPRARAPLSHDASGRSSYLASHFFPAYFIS